MILTLRINPDFTQSLFKAWIEFDNLQRIGRLSTHRIYCPDANAANFIQNTIDPLMTDRRSLSFESVAHQVGAGRRRAWSVEWDDVTATITLDDEGVHRQFESFMERLLARVQEPPPLDDPVGPNVSVRRGRRPYQPEMKRKIVEEYLDRMNNVKQEDFAEQHHISIRTLTRWLAEYKEDKL